MKLEGAVILKMLFLASATAGDAGDGIEASDDAGDGIEASGDAGDDSLGGGGGW